MKMSKAYQGNLNIRFSQVKEPKKVKICSSRDAYNELVKYYGADVYHKEAFVVMYLNQANEIICIDTDTVGAMASTSVEISSVLRKALVIGCRSMIVAHNHPSGNTKPSEADRRMTKKLVEACKLLEISVLDHVIVTGDGSYSFADNGERSMNG